MRNASADVDRAADHLRSGAIHLDADQLGGAGEGERRPQSATDCAPEPVRHQHRRGQFVSWGPLSLELAFNGDQPDEQDCAVQLSFDVQWNALRHAKELHGGSGISFLEVMKALWKLVRWPRERPRVERA